MAFQLEPSKATLFIDSSLVPSLKTLSQEVSFIPFSVEPFEQFSSNPAFGQIAPFKKNCILEAISHIMAVKDKTEIASLKNAGYFLSQLLKTKVVGMVETKVAEMKALPPEAFARQRKEEVESSLKDSIFSAIPEFKQSLCLSLAQNSKDEEAAEEDGMEIEALEESSIVVGREDIQVEYYRFDSQSETADREFKDYCKVFLIRLKAAVDGYECCLSRTIVIDFEAARDMEKRYNVLVQLFRRALIKCKEGRTIAEVVNFVENAPEEDPAVSVEKGYGRLLSLKGFPAFPFELKEDSAGEFETKIPPKSLALKQGMAFKICVKVSFSGMSLELCDSVVVSPSNASLLTHCGRKFDKISYSTEASEKSDKTEAAELASESAQGREGQFYPSGRQRRRNVVSPADEALKKLKPILPALEENAKKFAEKLEKEKEYLLSLSQSNSGSGKTSEKEELAVRLDEMALRRLRSPCDFPKINLAQSLINIDESRKLVFLPILGRAVPFSLGAIKSVVFSELGEIGFIKFSFEQDALPRHVALESASEKEVFPARVKDLTFKSKKIDRLSRIAHTLKTMLKNYRAKVKERVESSGVSTFAPIALRRDPAVLRDVQLRPNLTPRRKTFGRLEAHSNGLRFYDNQGQRLDVNYSNISSAIFQEFLDTECYVMLHFELKNPLLCNKKQTKFLQVFFDSVSSMVDSVTAYGHSDSGAEARNIQRFEHRFRQFVEAVKRDVRFETCLKELKISGNLARSITPFFITGQSFVALNDTNPLVVRLEDVRLVYLERMVAGVNMVDFAVVFWDVFRDPVRVSQVDKEEVELVVQYFQAAGVRVLSGAMNMDWKNVIGTIKKDVRAFVEEGGWDFLEEDDDEQDPDFKKDEEDAEDVVSESDLEEEESEGESGSEDETEMSGESADVEEEEESGASDVVDWSEETADEDY